MLKCYIKGLTIEYQIKGPLQFGMFEVKLALIFFSVVENRRISSMYFASDIWRNGDRKKS